MSSSAPSLATDSDKMERTLITPGELSVYQSAESSRPVSPGRFPLRRAITSFDNLVALANYQERAREARKLVWRDRGEPVVELVDVRACIEHATAGGLRSATLAFSVRAAFSLVLALIRMRNIPRSQRLALVRRAIIGSDTWRFSAMMGTFVSTYKFLLNALPLLIPAMRPRSSILASKSKDTLAFDEDDDDRTEAEDPRLETAKDLDEGITFPRVKEVVNVPTPSSNRREARLSLSAHAQMVLIRKKTRRWHAALAGAIAAALGILWEKRGRRTTIAQQMFVRGLQGSWNAYTSKRNIHVPHGAVIVFSIACGQILYAALMRPDTLPRSYVSWFVNASKVPAETLQFNRDLVRKRTMNIADIEKVINRPYITPRNRATLQKMKERISSPSPYTYFPYYAPCAGTHPHLDSCYSGVPVDRFVRVFRWMLPIYGALHVLPPILFRRKVVMKDPFKFLFKATLGTGRSAAFLGVFVVIYQTINCWKHRAHEYLSQLPVSHPFRLRQGLLDSLLISSASFWLPGIFSGLALFIEEERRRPELAMYVLPKALESAWTVARGKVGLKPWKGGEVLLAAMAMSMVMATYQNDPQHLSGFVRKIIYQFIGPN